MRDATDPRGLSNIHRSLLIFAGGRASRLGELYNELPDRVSDVAIIVGAGYAAGGLPVFGYAAAVMAILTAYVRAVGKAAGAANLFGGPMASYTSSSVTDVRWLKPTRANIAKATITIPPGFHRWWGLPGNQ